MFKKLLLLTLFLPVASFCQLSYENQDTVIPELVVSGRSMALGNAFSARVDDSMSAFYNPAGLGTVRKFEFRISDLYFDNDADLISMTTSAGNFFENLLGDLSIDGTRQLLIQNNKNLAYSRFNFMPNIVTRYFQTGYFYSQQSWMGIPPNQASPTYEWDYRRDQGGFLAANISFLGGVFKLGATGIYLFRKEYQGSQPANQTVIIQSGTANMGQGIFGIAGFRFTYPIDWLPTLSASYQNFLNGEFTNYGVAPVSPYPPNLTLAFSLSPQVGKLVRLHIEGDYVDALRENPNVSDLDRIELSMELDYDRSSFMRIGYLDGYITGGIGWVTTHFNINLSTYGMEATLAPGEVIQDRRYVLSMSFGI